MFYWYITKSYICEMYCINSLRYHLNDNSICRWRCNCGWLLSEWRYHSINIQRSLISIQFFQRFLLTENKIDCSPDGRMISCDQQRLIQKMEWSFIHSGHCTQCNDNLIVFGIWLLMILNVIWGREIRHYSQSRIKKCLTACSLSEGFVLLCVSFGAYFLLV